MVEAEQDQVPVPADGEETPGKDVGRKLPPNHLEVTEPPAMRPKFMDEEPGPIPVVDESNAIEVALQKFGLRTLCTRQQQFEKYIDGWMTRLESSYKMQLGKHQLQLNEHEKKIRELQDNYESLKTILEESENSGTGALQVDGLHGNWATERRSLPARVRVRGLAPYGADKSARMRREEHDKHVIALRAMLPPTLRDKVLFESAYATNHEILARVQGGGELCWEVREILQARIDEAAYKIRDYPQKVSVEPTAERKWWYRNFFASLRAIQSKIHEHLFEPNYKALSIISKINMETLGRIDRKTGTFVWDDNVVGEQLGTSVEVLRAASRA